MTPEEIAAAEAAAKAEVEAAGNAAKVDAEAKGASADEVKAAVEKARKEEKDKLYPQIEALKNSMTEIQEVLRAEREEKEAMKRAAEEKAETKRLQGLSESDKMLEAVKRIEVQLAEERTARKAVETMLADRDRKTALETYKQNAIKLAGDEILPELVGLISGTSDAEIDAAIANAKARTVEITARFKNAKGDEVRRALSGPTSPDTAALEEQELAERIGQVDPERYKSDPKYRDQILAQAVPAMYRSGR